jgi:hypothetical protein
MLMETEGELIDFIEEFSDGRIQFGFLRVKDPNTTLLKFVLVAWVCSLGLPCTLLTTIVR